MNRSSSTHVLIRKPVLDVSDTVLHPGTKQTKTLLKTWQDKKKSNQDFLITFFFFPIHHGNYNIFPGQNMSNFRQQLSALIRTGRHEIRNITRKFQLALSEINDLKI